jgi:manganese/zinc/iron transport system permease protein
MHYVLKVLVAITTVAAFESVGSILVIAMLIVPPATAGLLTERLGRLLVLSVLLAVLSALLGHAGAIAVPGWLGYAGSTNTAGMMGVAAGLLFGLAFLAAPRAGLISRAVQRLALTLRIIREDMLGLLFRIEEVEVARGGAMAPAGAVAPASGRWTPGAAELRQAVAAGRLTGALALRGLRQAGLVAWSQGAFALTVAGRAAARDLVRSHRLWEVYLAQRLAMPVGRLHDSAERLEHVTDAGLRERLAQTLAHPQTDPHGARIPAASPPADAP